MSSVTFYDPHQPLSLAEARLRREQLEMRLLSDARSKYATALAISLFSSCASVPFLRYKTLLQCASDFRTEGKPLPARTAWDNYKALQKTDGHGPALYRGGGATLAYLLPVTIVKHSAMYNMSRDLVLEQNPFATLIRGVTVGCISATAAIGWNAFAIAQTKMLADFKTIPEQSYRYNNIIEIIRGIRTFSGTSRFFTGALPTLLGQSVFFTSLFFLSGVVAATGLDTSFPLLSTLGSSILAHCISHPFDTVRTQMQYRVHTDISTVLPPYRNMLHCIKHIWNRHGASGFMQGISPSVGGFLSTFVIAASLNGMYSLSRRTELHREYLTKMQERESLSRSNM